MAEERGLLVAGEVIAGTEWIRRDPDAWWDPLERGTRKRAARVDMLVGHWTGGESGGAKRADRHGPIVVRNMKARKRPDGSPMEVAIQFVIGAPGDDWAGPVGVWQTADIGLTACCHVSKLWNPRSIGVEVVNAGLPGPNDTRNRPRTRRLYLGKISEVLAYSPGQLHAWVRLAEALAALNGKAGISIPRRVPHTLAMRRLTAKEARSWAGGGEHLLSPTTTRRDAAGMLIDALNDAGWEAGTLSQAIV